MLYSASPPMQYLRPRRAWTPVTLVMHCGGGCTAGEEALYKNVLRGWGKLQRWMWRLCSVGSFDRYSKPKLNPYCTLHNVSTPQCVHPGRGRTPAKLFMHSRGGCTAGVEAGSVRSGSFDRNSNTYPNFFGMLYSASPSLQYLRPRRAWTP